jgi:hypothetical protein
VEIGGASGGTVNVGSRLFRFAAARAEGRFLVAIRFFLLVMFRSGQSPIPFSLSVAVTTSCIIWRASL